MRPQLRPDVYCAAVDGGAYLLAPTGPVRLTGASVAAWIARLGPSLNGEATLAELTAPMSPPRRAMVEKLVRTLHGAGVVRDLDEAAPVEAAPVEAGPVEAGPDRRSAADHLTAAEVADYAPELRYLGYFHHRPAAALARLRRRPALVAGSGPMVRPLVAAALRSGLRRLRVAAPPEALPGLAGLPRRDPSQRVTCHALAVPAPDRPDQWAALLEGAGLVLHAAEPDLPAAALERACATAGVPLAQAVVVGGEVWLVPVAEDGSPAWSGAGRRLAATAPVPSAVAASGPVPARTVTVAAARLVQDGFRALAGVRDATRRTHLLRVAPDGLASERHRYLPHPFALPAAPTGAIDLPARVAALAATPRLTESEFSQRAARGLDPRLGLFTFRDHDWEQVPLSVSEVVTADPVGWLPAGAYPRAIGSGLTLQAARCAAAQQALARYATLLVDPRRLVDPVTCRALTTDPAADPRPGATWGYEVDVPDQVRLVPARSVFTVLADPTAELPVGAAAGLDWSAAVAAALVSHARARAVAQLPRATTRFPAVDLAAPAVRLPDAGERCRRLLAGLGELPECFDLTGPLGLPTFAFCRGSDTTAVTAGMTVGAALAGGLQATLLAAQSRIHDQPGYAPVPAPPVPVGLRGGVTDLPDRPPATPASVAARLRAAGRVAVAVPLDHDPAVSEILPFLVQVVLVDG